MKLLTVLQHPFELWNPPPWLSERLHQDFPVVEAVQRSNYQGIEEYIRDAEIAVTLSLCPEQFKAARKLRWIHSPAAAVHQLMFPELINSEVILTNASDVHGPVVAEHVIALIFALARCLPQAVRLQEKHVWGQEPIWFGRPRPRELAGATLGLVGLGSIGKAVARHASNLGMRVIAVRENPGKERPGGVHQVFASTQLDEVLSQSDFVVLAVPVTPATVGLMAASRLARMKPDACLINVGRGPLVDDAALIQALREKAIGGLRWMSSMKSRCPQTLLCGILKTFSSLPIRQVLRRSFGNGTTSSSPKTSVAILRGSHCSRLSTRTEATEDGGRWSFSPGR
jgi:phosphoglycerate dehydrogenase-like enzyme